MLNRRSLLELVQFSEISFNTKARSAESFTESHLTRGRCFKARGKGIPWFPVNIYRETMRDETYTGHGKPPVKPAFGTTIHAMQSDR